MSSDWYVKDRERKKPDQWTIQGDKIEAHNFFLFIFTLYLF